jgi:hypothetical protein
MGSSFFGRNCIAAIAIGLLLIGVNATAQPGSEHAPTVKTAGQTGKNIQVFKELPESQLDMVMDLMATSLGVRCGYCHVQDTSGWHFEKDDKGEKRKARKMIQMVIDLNSKTFGSRSAVTCYTCHRGATEPIEVIPIPQPAAKPRKEESAAIKEFPAVEAILAKCEKGFGGSDAISKIKSRVTKGKAVDSQGHEMPQEISQMSPDQYLSVTTVRDGVQRLIGFDGATGWMSSPRGTRELPAEEAKDLRDEAALFPIQHLREIKKVTHVREVDTVGGVGAYVLAAQLSRSAVETYYIDTTSGLLLRKVVTTDTPIGLIPEQVEYSDYRAVDGVMVPYTVKKAAVDPHDGSLFRVTSVEQNVALDTKKFYMPETKK